MTDEFWVGAHRGIGWALLLAVPVVAALILGALR